jgi:hypothetical protein
MNFIMIMPMIQQQQQQQQNKTITKIYIIIVSLDFLLTIKIIDFIFQHFFYFIFV